MKSFTVSVFLAALSSGVMAAAESVQLTSPAGHLVLTFQLKPFANTQNCPCYRVDYRNRPVIVDSRLGLELDSGSLGQQMNLLTQTVSSSDQTWSPVCGERAQIRDHYRQLLVVLQEAAPPHRIIHVTFRAYDEGVAFCYTLPEQPGMEHGRIRRENSEFCFRDDCQTWATYSGQGAYQEVPLSDIKAGCERPLVVRVADNSYVALAEAKLVDYARMKFAPLKGARHGVVSQLDGAVESSLPLTTPWRVVMPADTPGDLLQNNSLILNLNDPCAIKDTSWIKPGKVIREVTLTTTGGKRCVDFAVQHGLQFVEYDAGWYGHEYEKASDATTVQVDPRRSKGPLDLREVINYADQRGIGILVYVNHLALEKQLDELLPLYRQWGVKGIKFGFVNVGSQRWTSWLHEAIRKCAAHELMVDVHDEYRVTGYSRTYPNLMTVEGIRGDETSPTNDVTLTYVFTRMLAGRADNTVCWTDGRVRKNATYAYQLAKPICIFSPWQFLFWYDRPALVETTPELEFFRHLPTTWDDTRVIHGRIGEYAIIARRKGDEWFIGCMNGLEPQRLVLPFEFLQADRSYVAHCYSDDPSLSTRTQVKVEEFPVRQTDTLRVELPARGGQVLHLVPASVDSRK